MHPISLVALVFAGVAIVIHAEPQYYYPSPYLRSSAALPPHIQDGRFFFGSLSTFTLTVSTLTTTATTTSVTTCTTSAAALSACTTAAAAGRRRRSIFLNEYGTPVEERNGLFYDEQHQPEGEKISETPKTEKEQMRSSRQLPFSIQPTFGAVYAPEAGFETQAPIGRFFLALGTATSTSTVTVTSTSSLTAICSSTTSYKTCG